MGWGKRLLKAPATQTAAAWLLAAYIRFVFATSRKTYRIDAAAEPYMSGAENGIFAFWHGRMMMCPTIEPPKRTMHVLISAHSDGKMSSNVIKHFGERTINGSTGKGGFSATKQILRLLQRGDNVSITPDGPRGPSQVAQKGLVTIARLSGKPVLPVTFSTSRYRCFNSWDRFMLAQPFGHIRFYTGAPIEVDKEAGDAEMENARQHIEDAMNGLTRAADEACHA